MAPQGAGRCVVWQWVSKAAKLCLALVATSVRPSVCRTVSSPPPSARTQCDLLSCKHIGSSIEKRFNKVNKSRHHSWYWGGGLRGRKGRMKGWGRSPRPSVFYLPLAVVITVFVATSCPPVVDFKMPFPYSSLHTTSFFPTFASPPPFAKKEKRKRKTIEENQKKNHWLGSGQPEQWLYQTYLRGCCGRLFHLGALEREAPFSRSPFSTSPSHSPTHSPTSLALKQLCGPGSERGREKHTERKGREIQWPSGIRTSPNFSCFFSVLRVLFFFFLFSLIPIRSSLCCSLLFFISPRLLVGELHEAQDPPFQSLSASSLCSPAVCSKLKFY